MRLHHRVAIITLALLCLSASICSAKVIYVKTTGLDTNNGLSWDTAKKTVQAGINASASGDDIWVAAGIYVERIALKAGTGLYGGFTGTETLRGQRNWKANMAVLDGNRGGSVVTSPSGATTTTVIDGFTIRNGKAPKGAGIYCLSSSPSVLNNLVTANRATDGGGGIYCQGSSATIANNTITGNITFSASYGAYGGGGMACIGPSSSATIADNLITGNSAYGLESGGGGIYCLNCTPAIINNTITSNSGIDGGGVYCNTSYSTIANNIVAFNSSGVSAAGGGIVLKSNCIYNPDGYNYLGAAAGTGDISADPKLVAVEYGQVHIQPTSPCRNAGLDSAVRLGWVDMDGQTRIQGTHVDIGADESSGATWSPSPVTIVRVTATGNDASDGSSWGCAKRTVQAGVLAASLTGGEVWVASGTYTGNTVLPANVYLYGGFAGMETDRNQRNWRTNITVLDGGQADSVVLACGTGRKAGIDGFTVRNGKSDAGGGICCGGPFLTIANNLITGNKATYTGTTICGGGGIYSSSSVSIISNMICANSAPTGAGIYCSGPSPRVVGNTIVGNFAGSGGGIFCTDAPTAVISNNRIVGNSTYSSFDGGGGICLERSSPTVANNTITGNSSLMDVGARGGGGIYCSASSPTVVNNTIAGNSGRDGGGLYCDQSSSPTVSNNIIAFNSSGIYGSQASLRSNCVCNPDSYDYSGVASGAGDIAVNPKLIAVEYGQVHIQADSPCVDAGDDTSVGAEWIDIDGQGRIQAAHVDMGADESDGATLVFTPTVIRVSVSGDDLNSGLSWGSAKRTVQAGAFAASLSGGEVWVATGVYAENIMLPAYAYLYGGFAGTESAREQRDWKVNVSVLDGRQAGSVVTTCGIGRKSGIDGFTIRNGSATAGGGVRCGGPSFTIANNLITTNTAIGGARPLGGGICADSFSAIITGNLVTGNSAPSGEGGGIYGGTTIDHNTVAGNSAKSGGGVRYSGSLTTTISNNTITGNCASNNGGGVNCKGPAAIANNTIAENAAQCGGGVACEFNSSITVTGNTINGNTASSTSEGGGGIYCSCSATVTNNVIVSNNAALGFGGGVYSYNYSPKITNNTIVQNTAQYGGGLAHYYGSAAISNNILAFNSSGVCNYYGYGTPVLRNNCVYMNPSYGYSGTSAGTGDISADPWLLGYAPDDYHIDLLSPCANTGMNVAPGLPSTDFDGESRIYAGTVDIGAYEARAYPPEQLVASIKSKAANEAVTTDHSLVTCTASKDYFYIESDDRSAGVLVFKLNHGMQVGMRAKITGTMAVSGVEKYITATSVVQNGTGSVEPLVVSNRDIGGGDWQYNSTTKAGQVGVREYRQVKVGEVWTPTVVPAVGMNNIGLLVTTFGKVTYSTTGYFYIDDGSGLMDADNYAAAYKGIRINGTVPVAEGEDPVGKRVKVTGAVSIRKFGSFGYRQVYARDVQVLD